ncbi:C6 zinc finger domain protein [Aspergillus lentulus]|nr:C6 zinc finger domain protein [Aspergillus lentulus]
MQADSPSRAEGERVARRWGRTRSGCLNCRKKRRKCDEGKPTCLRCRKRGESCQWGMRVTFREANTQMLVHDPRQSENRTHKSFQIMDVTSEVIRDYHQSSPVGTVQHPLLDRGSATPLHHAQDPGRREEEARCDLPKLSTSASQPLNSDDSELASEDLSMGRELSRHSSPDQSGDMANTKLSGPGGRTELSQPTAAGNFVDSNPWLQQVLHKSPAVFAPGPGLDANTSPLLQRFPECCDSTNYSPDVSLEDGVFLPGSDYLELHSTLRSHLMQEARSRYPSRRNSTDSAGPARSSLGREGFTTVPIVQLGDYEDYSLMSNNQIPVDLPKDVEYVLWKNWLEEIAPWLDKFDSQRHFQYTLPVMAQSHEHLRYAMLAVSARQQEQKDKTLPIERSLMLYHKAIQLLLPQLPTRTTAVIGSCVVLCVLEMLSCAPKAWRRHLDGCAHLMQAVGINGFVGGVEQALFWCFARMDVCGGLISSIKTLIPVNHWASMIDLNTDIGLFQSVSTFETCANQAVYLCAQTLDLLAPSHLLGRAASVRCDPSDVAYMERWLKLWRYMEDWHVKRPKEMKPIVNLPSTDPFPTILFSNAAAISGNQLYHTAAILLLQSKPTNVRLDPKPRSILWHARQICGISMSNDHHGAWTNSIQPLWIAGQWMSHPSEHQAILRLLEKIEQECGWPTKWRAVDLQEFWGDLSQ